MSAKARILAGHQMRYGIHQMVPGRDPRYFTVLRDPADRILSVYNFRMQQEEADVPFFEWFESYPRNNTYKWMKRAFALEGDVKPDAVMQRLDDFWFVGVTEHLNDDLPALFTRFGVPAEWIDQRASVTDKREVDRQLSVPRMFRWAMGNVVYRKLEMSEELRERIHARNQRDLKLYRYAVRRREETRGRLTAD